MLHFAVEIEFAGATTWNYVENSLPMKRYHRVQHFSVHLCAVQFILPSVYRDTLCILISCLFTRLS